MADTLSIWGLFLSAFISSTLLPGGSEAVLGVLAAGGGHDVAVLVTVATLGNTLGGMTSWGIGWLLARRWPGDDPAKPAHRRAVLRVRRRGAPALLLSWLPVVGDPLCVAAGWLRIPFWRSLLLIGAGKLGRYVVVVWIVS